MTMQARINFGRIKGFPQLSESDKIETTSFLGACREIVQLIESFGTIFSPVVYDVNGNIEKLHKAYLKCPENYTYLEDLVALDAQMQMTIARDALCWLKRALELMHSFFANILNDQTAKELLTEHMQDAYEKTLKPHHGWLVREAFNFIYRWLPYRSQLIGQHKEQDENVKHMECFLNTMNQHLCRINRFLSS